MFKIILLTVFSVLALGIDAVDPDCTKPPQIMMPENCCKSPDMVPDALEKNCLANGDPKLNLESHMCFMECIYNATGIGPPGGPLDDAKTKTFLTTALGKDPAFLSLTEKGFQKCVPMTKEILPKITQKIKCNPFAGVLFTCVFHDMWTNCPAANWQDNAECNAVRAYMKACPLPSGLKA